MTDFDDANGDINYKSLEAYTQLTYYVELMLNGIGFNVLASNYKWGFRVIFMYACIFSSISFATYSLYILRDDPYELLKGMAVIGIPMKEITLSATLLYYGTDIRHMHEQLLHLHRNCRGAWSEKLLQWVHSMDRLLRLQVCIYVGTGVFMVFFPPFYYLSSGEKMLLFTIRIPYLDPTTDQGFLWYYAYEVLCAVTTVAITFTGDAVFVLLCFSAAAYLDLVRLKCDRLSLHLRSNASRLKLKSRAADEISKLLLSTVVAGINADQFVDRLCKVYNVGFLVIIFCSGLSLALCIMAGKLTTWVIAYPLGFSLFYGIMVFSFIGSVLETKSEELTAAVYNIDWYLLPVTDRRTLLMMLRHTQKIAGIKIFGSTRMNVETGMAIMKTIYSGYMMLDGAF